MELISDAYIYFGGITILLSPILIKLGKLDNDQKEIITLALCDVTKWRQVAVNIYTQFWNDWETSFVYFIEWVDC